MSAAVSMVNASKWFGAVIGVNEVTLDIEPGITGLLGPNGAGKSTLMKLIVGQIRPSQGDVRVLGSNPWRRAGSRREIGFAPEVDAFHEDATGRAFVLAMARLSGLSRREARRRTGETLELVGMSDRADKRLKACSKGMRQRIKLAQALVHEPRVLVLDEPLSGIDPPGRIELAALFRELRDRGKTVLVSTHILHEVESITDRIVLMARGRVLAAGKVSEIRRLLDDHPLTVRIVSGERRALATALVALDSVTGVAFGPEDDIIVKTSKPDPFFRDLSLAVRRLEAPVSRVEALDASAEAVFAYLVAGSGFGGGEGAA